MLTPRKTCLAALYCIISVAFFWSNVGLLVMAACDGLLLIAFIVISVVLGRPLSYVDCSAIASADANTNASSAYAWVMSVGHNLKGGDFLVFTGATKANCYESKGAWGLCIALRYALLSLWVVEKANGVSASFSSRLSCCSSLCT